MYIPCNEAISIITKVLTFWHSPWPLIYIYVSKNFKICNNFQTIRGMASIFHINNPCGEAYCSDSS